MRHNGGYQTALCFLLNFVLGSGSKLPKFVDQQLNNQANEGVRDVIIPLQTIACMGAISIDCFRAKPSHSLLDSKVRFIEFQVSASATAMGHRYKLIAYRSLSDSVSPVMFESQAVRPDPILADLIFDLSLFKQKILEQSGDMYLLLVCIDCQLRPVAGKSQDGIGFLIMKTVSLRRRVRRRIEFTIGTDDCPNNNVLTRCCLEKVIVSKTTIFENSSRIVAPNTIPVTYCRGSCYQDMFDGNHNYALLRYFHTMVGREKTKIREQLPCCSARRFRDLYILYEMPNGTHEMVLSKNLVIESCKCM